MHLLGGIQRADDRKREELRLGDFAIMLGGVHGAQTVPRSELTAAAWAGTAAALTLEVTPSSEDPSGVLTDYCDASYVTNGSLRAEDDRVALLNGSNGDLWDFFYSVKDAALIPFVVVKTNAH